MDRWYWTDSSMMPGELAKYSCACKRLYDGDDRTSYEDGHLSITNVRLIWKHPSQSKSLGLSLALVVLAEEETGGFLSSAKLVIHLSPRPPEQPDGPVGKSSNAHIKLAIRQSDLQTSLS
jgi:ESCRT-II complex subunit VPS36